MKKIFLFAAAVLTSAVFAGEITDTRNLLINSDFSFNAFTKHRDGKRQSDHAYYAPFWNADDSESLTVFHANGFRRKAPNVNAANGVKLHPGKSFHQFFTLPEADLYPGNAVSLSFVICQSSPKAVKAELKAMKIDSEDGTWCPNKDFKLRDKRTFSKMSRGELVAAKTATVTSDVVDKEVECKIENFVIPCKSTRSKKSYSKDTLTVGVEVRFTNTSEKEVWIFAPSLVRGPKAFKAVGSYREIPEFYRHIPRTMQKLWKGEPLHIVFMGSSIDRGSANPPLYPYDENPASPKFKQPLSDSHTGFSTKIVGRPDLDPYYGWSNHYFSCAGRLKVELMKKFNLTGDKILMNFMAADGSCVGEAHSGLKEYCELALAPNPGSNGHKSGYTWKQLYPGLFARPEGPRPDLVIFGSGANEKTDTPDECAVFEGTIRYIQRNYPGTEFVACMYRGAYGSPNPVDMQAIALRYGIPYIDFGTVLDGVLGNIKANAVGNNDGHPQAAIHYLWFKQLERAFDCAGTFVCGIPQKHLPEKIMDNTDNWEGEMRLYKNKESKRFFKDNRAFILDDGAFNSWCDPVKEPKDRKQRVSADVFVDGKMVQNKRRTVAFNADYYRNSFYRYGRYSFTDRHVLEVSSTVKLSAVHCKQVLNRTYYGVESGAFAGLAKSEPWKSETGYPYGRYTAELKAGESCTLRSIGNAFSIVWVDTEKGGDITVEIDGKKVFSSPANVPYTFIDKSSMFIENRKGISGLAYGVHEIVIKAGKAPVKLMGVYSYDTRSNRSSERVERGYSYGGAHIFSAPFKAVPVIRCFGNLKLVSATPEKAVFSGSGSYEIIGE